uniref:L-type lectin-like domain-containing protein n=1 Tax=Glossina pallidipes TaxID=7398 RepID=A0A1B0A8V2_GLOPL
MLPKNMCIRLKVGVGEELHDFIQHRLLGLPIGPAYLAAMEYGAQFRHSGEELQISFSLLMRPLFLAIVNMANAAGLKSCITSILIVCTPHSTLASLLFQCCQTVAWRSASSLRPLCCLGRRCWSPCLHRPGLPLSVFLFVELPNEPTLSVPQTLGNLPNPPRHHPPRQVGPLSPYQELPKTSVYCCHTSFPDLSKPCMTVNWEIHVTFKVHGKGTELFGDGFAIWYTKDRMQPGTVFGSKDNFSGLVVILDTYSNHNGPHNHQHPYLSAMVNNSSWSYDHDGDGTHTQLAGCEVRFRNYNFDTHISIRYENNILSVSTDMENGGEWKNCFVVNNVELPTGYFFGISATTGDLSGNHDIFSFKFYDLDSNVTPEMIMARANIIPNAKTFEPPREHKEAARHM